MPRSVSLVAARKDLGRIVAEVGRTGTPMNLTRRGKVVARIVPEEERTARDPLGVLRGSLELKGSFADLHRDLRTLRKEAAADLDRRTRLIRPSRAKRHG